MCMTDTWKKKIYIYDHPGRMGTGAINVAPKSLFDKYVLLEPVFHSQEHQFVGVHKCIKFGVYTY